MSLSSDVHLNPDVLSPRPIAVPLSLAPGARAPLQFPPPLVAALVATSKSERPHKYNPLGGN